MIVWSLSVWVQWLFTCHTRWAGVSWERTQICSQVRDSSPPLCPAPPLTPADSASPHLDPPCFSSAPLYSSSAPLCSSSALPCSGFSWISQPELPSHNSLPETEQQMELKGLRLEIKWTPGDQNGHIQHIEHCLPMESSKVIGLVPTDGSIIVISNRDANSRKSSLSPRKPWRQKNKNKKDLRAAGRHSLHFLPGTPSHLKVCLKGWSSVLDPLLYILPLR